MDFNLVLRSDARRDPPEKGEARAGSERTSSPRTQIAKQNRSAGEPAPTGLFKPHLKNWSAVKLAALKGLRGGARGDQDSVRPSDEHAIWRSEVRRGEGSRGTGHAVLCHPTCLFLPSERIWAFFLFLSFPLSLREVGVGGGDLVVDVGGAGGPAGMLVGEVAAGEALHVD